MIATGLPASALGQSAETDVVSVIDAYHAALASGDSAAALSLLADDVTILESGGVEDKEHYRSGHLAGDMRFAQAVPRERSEVRVTLLGDVAWAWSTHTSPVVGLYSQPPTLPTVTSRSQGCLELTILTARREPDGDALKGFSGTSVR